MHRVKGEHHRGSFHVRARKVRDAANADPEVRCWRCGGLARAGDPWTAGHVRDGDPSSPLAAEHASCNYSAGARSKADGFRTSRQW